MFVSEASSILKPIILIEPQYECIDLRRRNTSHILSRHTALQYNPRTVVQTIRLIDLGVASVRFDIGETRNISESLHHC